jgi:predicted dehydrogenase
VMSLRVNAGYLPPDHWVHSEKQGRSRIVGEMTHFLDLICAVTGARIGRIHAARVSGDGRTIVNNDNLAATLELDDGSVASLAYSGQGTRSTPREQIEIWTGGSTITSVDSTITVLTSAAGKKTALKTRGAQAGYAEELAHFVQTVRGEVILEPSLDEAMHIMEAAFAIETSLASGQAVTLGAVV